MEGFGYRRTGRAGRRRDETDIPVPGQPVAAAVHATGRRHGRRPVPEPPARSRRMVRSPMTPPLVRASDPSAGRAPLPPPARPPDAPPAGLPPAPVPQAPAPWAAPVPSAAVGVRSRPTSVGSRSRVHRASSTPAPAPASSRTSWKGADPRRDHRLDHHVADFRERAYQVAPRLGGDSTRPTRYRDRAGSRHRARSSR